MSKGNKRTWKLQDIQAHDGAINCLSIGHRSGKVIATGGDDKKVNLWALGKSFCILSLKGHTSGIDSVRFNGNEDTVVAGSQSGAVKIWNLEASKILRTLSGHKANVRALDFHPFGDIVASGSLDTNIKLWDYRRKGCIFTLKGHTGGVNCLRFSPDGKWIASAGDDGCSRLWDMTTGKQIGEFRHPSGSVTCLTFHPVDFLMATAGSDRTVKFWDLDTFELISSTDIETTPMRNIFIHPEGRGAYAGCQDHLKVYGWEPAVCYDSVNVGWGKPSDIVAYQDQLIGASIHQSNVQIYVADLTKLKHTAGDVINGQEKSPNPFLNPSRRRSFITKSQQVKQMENGAGERTMEEDKKKDINDIEVVNYQDIFNPKHELPRDSDKRPSLPTSVSDDVSRLKQRQASPSIHNDQKRSTLHNRSLSQQSKQPQTITASSTKPQATKPLQRGVFDVNKIKRSQISQRSRDSPRSKTTTITNFKHHTTNTTTNNANNTTVNTASNKVPSAFDLTVKLGDLSVDNSTPIDFNKAPLPYHAQTFESFKVMQSPNHLPWIAPHSSTPTTLFHSPPPITAVINDFSPTDQQMDELSDEKSVSCISGGHGAIINVFSNRHRNLQVFKSLWMAGNVKMALDSAVSMNDQSVLQDIVNLLLQTPSLWTLDTCVCILPVLCSLLSSRYEAYANTSLMAVKFILRTYSTLIKDNLSNVSSIGVNIIKEERFNKSKRCYQMLKEIEHNIDGRFCPSSCSVTQGVHLREIKLLLGQMD